MNQVIDCNFDIHELVLTIQNGKEKQEQHVAYDKIQTVRVTEITEKGWLGSKRIQAIEITARASDTPYVLRKDVMKRSFDQTLSTLERFADKYELELIK